MENNTGRNGFSYTYSAKEQAELRRIREKYTQTKNSENKLERLRRLDRSVTEKAQVISLCTGIPGVLIFGLGMSLFMSDFGATVGLGPVANAILGIVCALVGGVGIGFAYPLYRIVYRKERDRVAPEIISLTDELMK